MKDYATLLAELMPIVKTGDFEKDVRAGYYGNIRNRCWYQRQLGIDEDPDTWYDDFNAFLLQEGIPQQYVSKVAYSAYERGHSSGEAEILNAAYDLIEIFN